jgi:hypothetical protein
MKSSINHDQIDKAQSMDGIDLGSGLLGRECSHKLCACSFAERGAVVTTVPIVSEKIVIVVNRDNPTMSMLQVCDECGELGLRELSLIKSSQLTAEWTRLRVSITIQVDIVTQQEQHIWLLLLNFSPSWLSRKALHLRARCGSDFHMRPLSLNSVSLAYIPSRTRGDEQVELCVWHSRWACQISN